MEEKNFLRLFTIFSVSFVAVFMALWFLSRRFKIHRNVKYDRIHSRCGLVIVVYFVVSVHTLPRNTNLSNLNNGNSLISTQDGVHHNGQNSTTALINAFIDSDDEPLYDKVASDEDYSSLPNQEQQKRSKTSKKNKNKVCQFFCDPFFHVLNDFLVVLYFILVVNG